MIGLKLLEKLGGPLILKAKDRLPLAKEAAKRGISVSSLFKKLYGKILK